MTYAQDTLTSANAANDFALVLDGLLTGAGWSTVETLTPSGNYRNRVYKSDGGSNICGYDWYLMLSWTALGTENYVEVWAGEGYDSGTHVLSGLAGGAMTQTVQNSPVASLSTGHFSADTMNASSHTVGSSPTQLQYLIPSAQNFVPGFQTLIPSSAFAYWMSTTLDHVVLFTTVATASQNAAYSTLTLDSGYASSDLYNHSPIIIWDADAFAVSSGFLGVDGITTNNYIATHMSFSNVFGAHLPNLTDEFFDAFAWAPHVYIDYLTGGGSTTPPYAGTAMYGGVHVGSAPDLYLVYGGSIGDTVTIDSSTYVLTGPLLAGGRGYAAADRPTVAVLVE